MDSWGSSANNAENIVDNSPTQLSSASSLKQNNHEHKAGKHLIYEANVQYNSNNNRVSKRFQTSVAAMTGSSVSNGNGHANGNGTNGTAATERGCWTIGLINSKLKYLR